MTELQQPPDGADKSELGARPGTESRLPQMFPAAKTTTTLAALMLLLERLGLLSATDTYVGFDVGGVIGLWHLSFAWLCPTYGLLGFVGNAAVCGLLYGSLRRLEMEFGTRWSVVFILMVGPLSLIGAAAVLRPLLGAVGMAGSEGLVLAASSAVALRLNRFALPWSDIEVELLRAGVWTGVSLALVTFLISPRAGTLGLIGMCLGALLYGRDLEGVYARAAVLGGRARQELSEKLIDGPTAQGFFTRLWMRSGELWSRSSLGERWGDLARSLGDDLIAREQEAPKYWDQYEPKIDTSQVRRGEG